VDILVVGGGALGQFYGFQLAQGGARVSYLVRPRQAGRMRDGIVLHRLRRLGSPVTRRFVPQEVFTDPAEVDGHGWDAVWLCVPSTALGEPWTTNLRDRIGTASVVTIGQDSQDRPTLERTWPTGQIVQVEPSVLAYQAPLGDETLPEPGMAYWAPPGSSTTVSGIEERARPVVTTLRNGGVRAKRAGEAGTGDRTAALTMPYIAAIEVAGWSLRAVRADLRSAAAAAREASTVVAALHGEKRSARLVTSPALADVVFRLLPHIAPFDVSGYLRYHFTKVGAQTRRMLDGWIVEGDMRALPVTHLRKLRRALPALPVGTSS
jgi:2-dehydropantoate 2-reductase